MNKLNILIDNVTNGFSILDDGGSFQSGEFSPPVFNYSAHALTESKLSLAFVAVIDESESARWPILFYTDEREHLQWKRLSWTTRVLGYNLDDDLHSLYSHKMSLQQKQERQSQLPETNIFPIVVSNGAGKGFVLDEVHNPHIDALDTYKYDGTEFTPSAFVTFDGTRFELHVVEEDINHSTMEITDPHTVHYVETSSINNYDDRDLKRTRTLADWQREYEAQI